MQPLDWMGGVSVVRLTVVSSQQADGRLLLFLKHLQLQRCPQQKQEVVWGSEVKGSQRLRHPLSDGDDDNNDDGDDSSQRRKSELGGVRWSGRKSHLTTLESTCEDGGRHG